MKNIDQAGSPEEVTCPRCGMDAQCSYADAAQTRVEIACSDCGRFELSKAEFDGIETDIALHGFPD